jgi:hypothetical protein
MVAPNYSEARKALALNSGLGRKPTAPKAEAIAAPVAAKPRGRSKTVAAPANVVAPEASVPKRRTLKASFGDTKVVATSAPKRRGKGRETASAAPKPRGRRKIVQAAE